MALNVDTTKPFRLPSELRALVDAIHHSAPSEPETEWLEWKSHVDLSEKRWAVEIAVQILGFANRQSDAAMRWCEGHAYLVCGASPGLIDGVSPVDPATLEARVEPYLGVRDKPRWELHYVDAEDATVLVIAIAPPQVGDRPFPLRKAHDGRRNGDIFVRRGAATAPASAADIDALVERMLHRPERPAADGPIRRVSAPETLMPRYRPISRSDVVDDLIIRCAAVVPLTAAQEATRIDDERRSQLVQLLTRVAADWSQREEGLAEASWGLEGANASYGANYVRSVGDRRRCGVNVTIGRGPQSAGLQLVFECAWAEGSLERSPLGTAVVQLDDLRRALSESLEAVVLMTEHLPAQWLGESFIRPSGPVAFFDASAPVAFGLPSGLPQVGEAGAPNPTQQEFFSAPADWPSEPASQRELVTTWLHQMIVDRGVIGFDAVLQAALR